MAFITAQSDVENYFINAKHIASLNQEISEDRVSEFIELATTSTREKSILALINIRTEAAIGNRNGGPADNSGELALKAMQDYDTDPSKWRRGKIVLNELRALLHKELKKNPAIHADSAHLVCDQLVAIKEKLWAAKVDA